MKNILTSLLAVAILIFAVPTQAQDVAITTHGDTTTIIQGSDTTRLIGIAPIGKLMERVLNDTMIDMNRSTPAVNNEESTPVKQARIIHSAVEDVTQITFTAIVLIVLIALLFNYLHRRRKYRMIERAIEKNYPLPPYMFGNNTSYTSAGAYPTPPPVETATGTPLETPAEGQPIPPPFRPETQQRVNWRAFTHAFTLVAVGIGLMIMFHNSALSGLCSIIVLLGLGKGFIEYQDQREAFNAWRKK